MADSTNPWDIPVGQFPIVAGYVDGAYAWSGLGWAVHAPSLHVGIAVSALTNDGLVLDVETGNATEAEAVDWVLMRRAAGIDPTVYVQESRAQAVYDAFNARGVALPHLWGALWDGVANVPFGWVAKQYANPSLVGAHYDESAVEDYWPGLDPLPLPAPVYGPGTNLESWSGLQVAVTVDIPAFGQELGVLASGLDRLG